MMNARRRCVCVHAQVFLFDIESAGSSATLSHSACLSLLSNPLWKRAQRKREGERNDHLKWRLRMGQVFWVAGWNEWLYQRRREEWIADTVTLKLQQRGRTDEENKRWIWGKNGRILICKQQWIPFTLFLTRTIWVSRLCEVIKSGGSVRQNTERSEGQYKRDEGCRRRGEWILDRTLPSIQMHIVCIQSGIVVCCLLHSIGIDWYLGW